MPVLIPVAMSVFPTQTEFVRAVRAFSTTVRLVVRS